MDDPKNPYDDYDGDIPFWDSRAYRNSDEEYYEEFDIELAEPGTLVDVVYCKNCRWRNVPYDHPDGCHWTAEEKPEDYDFCSCGEEK